MTGILLILAIAVIVEGLVQYGKNIYQGIIGNNVKTAVTQIAAIIIAVLLCFAANADIFEPLGIAFNYPYIGVILTGIFASRGSNYVSDLIKQLQNIGVNKS